MMCEKCKRIIYPVERALTKKLINRGCEKFLCLTCLSEYFKVSEELLIQKAVEFQVQGCTLFEGIDLFF